MSVTDKNVSGSATGRSSSDKGRGDRSANRNNLHVAWIGVIGAVVAAIVGGIFTLAGSSDKPTPQPPSPAGPTTGMSERTPSFSPTEELAVDLTPTVAGKRAVQVEAVRHGAPAAGHELWFVLEVHRATGNVEYYPRQKLSTAHETLRLSIPSDADTAVNRTGQVFDVEDRAIQKKLAVQAADNDGISNEDLVRRPCDCALGAAVDLPFAA